MTFLDGDPLTDMDPAGTLAGQGHNARHTEANGALREIRTWIGDVPGTYARVFARSVLLDGAVGDDTTACLTAIQTTIDTVNMAGGGTVEIPFTDDGGLYRINGTLNVPAGVSVKMDPRAELRYEGTGVAVSVASPAYTVHTIRVRRIPASDEWYATTGAESTSVGVRVTNSRYAVFHFPLILGFSTGLDVLGDGNGNVGNTYTFGILDQNKVGLHSRAINTGWANQNRYAGDIRIPGTFTHDIVGTRLAIIDTGGSGNDFFGVNFEGAAPEINLECKGDHNVFVGCRWEGVGENGIQITGDYNQFIGGHGNYGPLPPSGTLNIWNDTGTGNQFIGGRYSTEIPGFAGAGAATAATILELAAGNGASASGTYAGTAIGHGAQAITAGSPVAIGRDASAASNAISIGWGAASSVADGVAAGRSTSVTGVEGVAIGTSATAAARGTAVGTGADAGASGVALGRLASVAHTSAVAVGWSSATSQNYQVALGDRHISLKNRAETTVGIGLDEARLGVRDNAGVQELFVTFANGTTKTIATDV